MPPRMSQRRRTKLTKTRMVRYIILRTQSPTPSGHLDCLAEEYYKNDYPDEESSDRDDSEGGDGAFPEYFAPLFFWKQLCVPVDIFHDDSDDGYDDNDWR